MQYEWVNEKNKMRNVFTGLTLILLLISSMTLQAGPVAPMVVELSQPDGTTFSAVPRGDEYANWMETTDGHTVIEENGTWYYAGKDNKTARKASPRGKKARDRKRPCFQT